MPCQKTPLEIEKSQALEGELSSYLYLGKDNSNSVFWLSETALLSVKKKLLLAL